MAKRLTETEKWKDRWYVGLSGEYKLAWNFCCDNCDHAGILEVFEPVCNAQIGFDIDWNDFVEQCAHRIEKIGDGQYFLRAFVEFQYGELNPENRVHKSVLRRLEKKGLRSALEAPSKALLSRTRTRTKKVKKDTVSNSDDWVFPDGWDCPEAREALDAFAEMRRTRLKKPITSKAATSKIFKRFDSVQHLIYAAETCEANDYQGLKTIYGRDGLDREPKAKRKRF